MSKKTEYIVPTWVVCAVTYGDDSGLSDDDCEALDLFMEQVHRDVENIQAITFPPDINEAKEFYITNDVNNLGGDCITMEVWSDL